MMVMMVVLIEPLFAQNSLRMTMHLMPFSLNHFTRIKQGLFYH